MTDAEGNSGNRHSLYRGMDRATLDREYDARGTVADIGPFLAEYAELSREARRDLEVGIDIPYGNDPAEKLDFFHAAPSAPVFLFIHGGYWRLLSKAESAFMAKPLVAAGISVAVADYGLAPEYTLDEITAQIRRCATYLWKHAGELGLDRKRIVVGGSSAGAHLAAMVLADDWKEAHELPTDAVAGAVLASGLYDLEPLRHCHPNEWLRLDKPAARRNSPIHLSFGGSRPAIVTWAGSETSEFKRQSRDFAKKLKAGGLPVEEFEIADRNHFNIITDLADEGRQLTRATIELVRRTA